MKKNSPHQNKEPKVSSLPARSKQALRETLLGLLRVKNFQSISVSELVEKSGYSRSTFIVISGTNPIYSLVTTDWT